MQYLSSKFDGNVMLKLPSTKHYKGLVGLMNGQKRDLHPWHKERTTNIKNGDGLTFKHSSCVDHVYCQNL